MGSEVRAYKLFFHKKLGGVVTFCLQKKKTQKTAHLKSDEGMKEWLSSPKNGECGGGRGGQRGGSVTAYGKSVKGGVYADVGREAPIAPVRKKALVAKFPYHLSQCVGGRLRGWRRIECTMGGGGEISKRTILLSRFEERNGNMTCVVQGGISDEKTKTKQTAKGGEKRAGTVMVPLLTASRTGQRGMKEITVWTSNCHTAGPRLKAGGLKQR